MSGVWEPWRPELDTDPAYDLARPAVNYIVCSTPRSGSGLLCRGLASTGRAGLPAEYFNVNQRGPLTERWCSGPSLSEYATALRARRTSPDGVFGTKLHWDQVERLRAEARDEGVSEPPFPLSADFLANLIPRARFLRIARLDLDRQAISLWNALHRGVWSARAGTRQPATVAPGYDFDEIERLRQKLALGELHWDRFLRANRITPVEVEYESLVTDFVTTIRRVMWELLGVRVAGEQVASPDSLQHAYPESEAVYSSFTGSRKRRATTYDLGQA